MKTWLLAFRPKTLTAAVVPIVAATSLAFFQQIEIRWWVVLLALLASLFIQIATNLINDAVDFRKGTDNKKRLGPMRVTQAGLLSEHQVLRAGFLFLTAAVAAGVPLIWIGGWPIVLIGLVSMISAYAYTAGPFPLAYRGLGDLFVILFFGVIAVSGLYYLLSGVWDFRAALLGLQVGLHCAVLISINNIRDMVGDRESGKRTIPVRFGLRVARVQTTLMLFLPFLLSLFWLGPASWAALLGLVVLPLAVSICWKIFSWEPSAQYNSLLGQSAALHFGFGMMTSIGLVLCQ